MAFIKGSFLQQGSKLSAFSFTRYTIYIAQKFCEVIVGTEALSVLLMVEVEETNKELREEAPQFRTPSQETNKLWIL